MIGIIGGGFGLYAWMPALCQFYPNETILMESRHKSKFDSRPELQQYKDRIKWTTTKKLFNESELLIIAIPPDKVFNYLSLINQSLSIKRIIVEKPICEDPEKSERFINVIEQKGIKICSSYLFIYTDWFKELSSKEKYRITWIKYNNNSKDSWKHKLECGGGKIFYKIHLLAISNFLNSPKIKFIPINFKDGEEFSISLMGNETVYVSESPFPNQIQVGEDVRIPYLKRLLYDFENNYEKVNKIMKDTNQLWKQEKLKLN